MLAVCSERRWPGCNPLPERRMHIRGLQEYQSSHLSMAKAKSFTRGSKIAVLAVGSMVEICQNGLP